MEVIVIVIAVALFGGIAIFYPIAIAKRVSPRAIGTVTFVLGTALFLGIAILEEMPLVFVGGFILSALVGLYSALGARVWQRKLDKAKRTDQQHEQP